MEVKQSFIKTEVDIQAMLLGVKIADVDLRMGKRVSLRGRHGIGGHNGHR